MLDSVDSVASASHLTVSVFTHSAAERLVADVRVARYPIEKGADEESGEHRGIYRGCI